MLKIETHGVATTENTGLVESFLKSEKRSYAELPFDDGNWEQSVEFAKKIAENFDKLIVLGVGGSALGAKAITECFGDYQKVEYWCDGDPFLLKESLLKITEPEKTAWLIVSKSGKTIEVMASVNLVAQYYVQRNLDFFKNTFAITQNIDSPILKLVKEKNIPMLEHPEDVGGRFSVFCPVGLVPAFFAGVDLISIKTGAQRAITKETGLDIYSILHPALQKKISCIYFWLYDSRLYAFGDWLEQLWSESLGQKTNNNEEPVPHFGVPVVLYGTKDHHSCLQQVQDGDFYKFVMSISGEVRPKQNLLEMNMFSEEDYLSGISLEEIHDIFKKANKQSLAEKGIESLNLTLDINKVEDLAELMMAFQVLIGIIGHVYNFNPYEQPGVELSKKIAIKALKESN